jgi:hypothetical protein
MFGLPKVHGSAAMVIGDSIGRGISFSLKVPADTKAGRPPQAVLDAVRANAANVSGKNVILSTGVSNNPMEVETANQQIEELLKAGARRVTVVGVGTKKNLQGVNERLRDISSSHGPKVRFLGPLSGMSRDRVHPRDYKKLAEEASE